jgi:large subunit ribosomal protein L18e
MASPLKITTTNKVLFDTIRELKKASKSSGVGLFAAVAEKLSGSASQRAEVNLSRIQQHANDGDKIIVAGKVLADGVLTKKVTVIAFKASDAAIAKIEAAGGKFMEIREFLKKPDVKARIFQ